MLNINLRKSLFLMTLIIISMSVSLSPLVNAISCKFDTFFSKSTGDLPFVFDFL